MTHIYSDFCDYLIKKKKSSSNTLASYQRDIKHFIVFLQYQRIDSFKDVDIKVIDNYVVQLKKENKSASTISRSLSSLRCFFKYLLAAKVISFNPMIGVKNEKKTSSDLPSVLTNKDVDMLLSSPDTSTVKGIRDKTMLEVLYATGIRVSELLAIKSTDINIDVGYVIINKSTPKERIVPLYPIAIQSLKDYITNARPLLLQKGNKNNTLFLNSHGSEMTRQGFWKIIKQYALISNITSDITPKTLRHSFATHLLENGADINMLKDMLGHSALSSTMVYTKVLKNKYKSAYENCHPRAIKR